ATNPVIRGIRGVYRPATVSCTRNSPPASEAQHELLNTDCVDDRQVRRASTELDGDLPTAGDSETPIQRPQRRACQGHPVEVRRYGGTIDRDIEHPLTGRAEIQFRKF